MHTQTHTLNAHTLSFMSLA